jgi:phospholipase/carboxylesterase
MLNDFHLPPLNGDAPKHVVIFLHGLGDSGDGGLLSIGQVWQPALPDCEFICPSAPFPYDMAPPGFGGRQWFSLQDFGLEKVEEGVKTAAPILDDYIDQILKTYNLPPERLALVGFSQGTMMALHVAPRRAQQIACVIGYSGMLSGADTLKTEKRSSPPVLLLHGTYDDVVAYDSMAIAERSLKKADIPVATVSCPGLGHSINDRGILEGLKFLQSHLT